MLLRRFKHIINIYINVYNTYIYIYIYIYIYYIYIIYVYYLLSILITVKLITYYIQDEGIHDINRGENIIGKLSKDEMRT